ncbi:Uncharacterised protein [Mycobacterium tuberculosis]|nr:Uncharacterised protein [Mycobacterium tuberculosis]
MESPVIQHFPKPGNLRQHAGDEILSSKTWIDRHQKDQIELVVHYLLQDAKRSSRIQHDTGLYPVLLNQMQRPVKMNASLRMYRDQVRTCLGERRNVAVRLFNHQMHVERQPRLRPDGFHYRRADRNVRNKMPIHDIHMNPVRPSTFHIGNLLAEHRKVGG